MKKRCALLLLSGFVIGTLHAQIDLTVINVPYNQQFDSLGSTTTGLHDLGTFPQGWTFVESGTNANTTYAAGTGSSNTGNTYSFGTDATDRALGGLQSGSLVPTIGARFLNQTGTTITALEISYRGEQWRLGSLSRLDKLDFQYSLDATGLSNGTWTNADNLDFISPVTSGTVGLLNGNSDNNSVTIAFTIEGLNITNGAMLSIRWTDFNATGADDGLAIDDFTITPIGTAGDVPTISSTPAALSFGEVNAGSVSYSQYQVIGTNLDSPLSVSVSHPAYALSVDNISFFPSIALGEAGGQVYVRFMPTENGPANTIINHSSGLLEKALSITGSGFVQADNIIPIVTARAQAVGTKVTVAGRITVANELGNPAYLQDGSGGIPVFDFDLANNVSIGDSVLVTGPVGVFNDQKQISGAGIFYTKADAAPRVLIPETILLSELAAHEGQLVRIDNVELANKNFVFYPQSTEVITDGFVQADLRIDGDTDIPGLAKPQTTTTITGVVGRFRTNAQLLPRFREDMPETSVPSAPTDSISKNKTLDVVTWNLEFFGAKKEDYNNEEFGPEDEALQLQNIKQVLDSLNADIVAVEEVSDEAMLAALVAQLDNYDFECSHRYSRSFEAPDNSFPPQKVCFIYDTTTIEITGTHAMFESRYDSARTIDPSLLPGYPAIGPSSFYSSGRLPFLITINATIEEVTEKINLIAIHAKSGASAGDWDRRAYDAAVLKDSLDAQFSQEQFIILGDLNDDLDQSITVGRPSPYSDFVNDSLNYLPISKSLSDAGARSTVSFGDVIDHQIISNELAAEYLEGSVQIIAPFRFIANYAATTSDHLPVISRYKLSAPVASFVDDSVTLAEDSSTYVVQIKLNKLATIHQQLNVHIDGDASYEDDYLTAPAAENGIIPISLSPGDSTVSFTVQVSNDSIDELRETIVLAIRSRPGLEAGDHSVFTLLLEDNDTPQIFFEKRFDSAQEGDEPKIVTMKLSTPVANEQIVTLTHYARHHVVYGTDYTTEPVSTGDSLSLTIPAGSSQVQFTITPKPDKKREKPWEIVSFYLANTSEGLTTTLPRLFVFTIIDVKRKLHFTVSPNPTDDIIRLECEALDEAEIIHVDLRNHHGGVVFKGSGTLAEINRELVGRMDNSRKGIYVLKVTAEDQNYLLRILKR